MLSPLAAWTLLAAQQPSNQIRYAPSANVQILFSRDLEPVPPEPSSRKNSRGQLGWETEAIWEARAPRATLRLTHWTYAKGKKPLMTPKEIATELFSNSELVNSKEELDRSYADRTVVDARVGEYPATIELYLDKDRNRQEGTLAFGDENQQWKVEISGDSKLDGMDRAIRTVISSVKPISVTQEQLAKGLTKMMNLPGTGFEIAAPASLTAVVATPDSARKCLWAYWYKLDLTDGFMISVQDQAYEDKKQPNLKADLDYDISFLRDGTRKFGKIEDQESQLNGWTTLLRVAPVIHNNRAFTMAWSYWASPGRTIFAVVKIADSLGGAIHAREIAKSLRPANATK